jgi:hypothetical protein
MMMSYITVTLLYIQLVLLWLWFIAGYNYGDSYV